MIDRRADGRYAPGSGSRSAAMGATLAARNAGTREAASVVATPTIIDTMMVRGNTCKAPDGKVAPMRLKAP